MSKLIRFVNHSLKHFFIRDVEDSCGSNNQFKDDSPYPFANSNFETVLVHRPEESAYCFVCREAFLLQRGHRIAKRPKRYLQSARKNCRTDTCQDRATPSLP